MGYLFSITAEGSRWFSGVAWGPVLVASAQHLFVGCKAAHQSGQRALCSDCFANSAPSCSLSMSYDVVY